MKVHLVYMTIGSPEEARRIASALVEARVAACANIFDGMNSIYRWEGRLCRDEETVVIAKTTEERLPALVDTVRRLHSYECPCIVSMPVSGGHTPFLHWVADEVAPDES